MPKFKREIMEFVFDINQFLNMFLLDIIITPFLSLFTYLGKKSFKVVKDFFEKNNVLNEIISKFPQYSLIDLGISDEDAEMRMKSFLKSPEVENVIRQVYAALITRQFTKNKALIFDEFSYSLALYLNVQKTKIKNFSQHIFLLLVDCCERVIQELYNQEILNSSDLKEILHYNQLLNEIDAINKNLEYLISMKKLSLEEIKKFEGKYRYQVSNRHKYIIPPNFDSVQKISVDDLYVKPNFITIEKNEKKVSLSFDEFVSQVYRCVILGNPGAGKSTFSRKLTYELSKSMDKRIFSNRYITPVLVILRDYGARKKEKNCSILEFIEETAKSLYQVPCPSGVFEYLLLNGRIMVIFDGLDELLDTSYRMEISENIESFCLLYPSVPVLITSREVGYEQAPLNKELFSIYKINDFNEDQIEDYAKKWFLLNKDDLGTNVEKFTNSFLGDSKIVPDLRSNPLMLSLICNIYRGEKYIPKNRPAVYEKCALMLFERWDKGRGIHYSLPFDEHIRPAMMYLANWIYSDEKLQSGVTENNLILKVKEYLYEKRFDDQDEAEKSARLFVNFCKGRAWVFTDVGTTKFGENLYKFTHRTFLEYFTSAYLVRVARTPEKLGQMLIPKIEKQEWDVVSQLAFQIQNNSFEDAGNELLLNLIDTKSKNINEKGNLLSFTARCLRFIIPSPKVINRIVVSLS